MPTSVCVLLSVSLFIFCSIWCLCVIFAFIPFFLSSYSWFFGFLLSMSGRSSSEGLKEDKEVSPLNSPSHKGRFQVGPLLWALSLIIFSLYCIVDKTLNMFYPLRWLQYLTPLPQRIQHQAMLVLTGKWDAFLSPRRRLRRRTGWLTAPLCLLIWRGRGELKQRRKRKRSVKGCQQWLTCLEEMGTTTRHWAAVMMMRMMRVSWRMKNWDGNCTGSERSKSIQWNLEVLAEWEWIRTSPRAHFNATTFSYILLDIFVIINIVFNP